MPADPYGHILTGVGLIDAGKLSDKSKDRYITEVTSLLVTGNKNGRGGNTSTQVFNSLIPLPPVPGPLITNVSTFKTEQFFWFDPDPGAALITTTLLDKSQTATWHAIFIDLLYEKIAVALDVKGSTPLFPMFDVSGPFDIDLPLPFTIPDLALKLKITPPQLLIKLADIGISLTPPTLPPIPQFKLLDLLPPTIPGIPTVELPKLQLPELLLGLIKLPFDLLRSLVLPPNIDLVLNIPGLPTVVFDIAFSILVKLLEPFAAIVPKLLLASLLIYLKNVVCMVCVDIVGMLVGANGTMTKTIAGLVGLV